MARKVDKRRLLPFRFAALFMAVLFTLAGAREGIAGYVCAKHSDHGEHAAAATADQHADHGGHGPAEHATHAEHAEHLTVHQNAAPHPHGEGEPCSCVGDCQPGQTLAGSCEEARAQTVDSTPPAATLAPLATLLPGTPKFLLPFSNGPPRLC